MHLFLVELIIFIILCIIFYSTNRRKQISPRKKSFYSENWENKTNLKPPTSVNELPGPKPFTLKIIGNLFQLPKSLDGIIPTFLSWHKTYGECYLVSLLWQDFVIIGNAPLAQSVLQSNDMGHLRKTDVYKFLKELDGLAFTSGERWQKMRKLAAPAFHYNTLKSRINISNIQADKLVDYLRTENNDKNTIELLLARCTVNIIIDSFISGPGNYSDADSLEYVKNWKRYTEITTYRMIHPYLAVDIIWRRHPLYKEMQSVIGKLYDFTDILIKPYLENGKLDDDKFEERSHTLIPQLLRENYPLDIIRSEVLTMLFGYEAFFLGLYYLTYMLALHPEHQTKCWEEVDIITETEPTIEQLTHIKHVECCLFESLRMIPPALIFGRKLEKDLMLENGVLLPIGTNIIIVPLVIHKLAEYYPNPSAFDPSRFLPENTKNRHPYSFLAFSSGPRVCLGMKPAIASIKIIMARLLKNFDISTSDKYEQVKFTASPSLVPENGLDLVFTPRQPNVRSEQ